MKVLITGFDPFGGEAINPSYEAVKLLDDVIEGYEIVKLELPTVFNKSLEILEKKILALKPDLVISVGQAGGRAKLSLEYVGINLNEARIPDNEDQQPSGPIKADGENAYFTTLPVKAMAKACNEIGVPAHISYTAGTYVCNHVLYGLLYIQEKHGLDYRAGFIHVPFIPDQVTHRGQVAFMPLDLIAKGLETCIKVAIKQKDDIQGVSGETH